jgi:hypothetical protein
VPTIRRGPRIGKAPPKVTPTKHGVYRER